MLAHKKNRWYSSALLIAICTAVIFTAGVTLGRYAIADKAEADSSLPYETLQAFAEVFVRIKKNYVEPVDDKTLLEDAIRGMLAGLDPHSNYLTREEFDELQTTTSGEFGGLGMEVTMENGFIKVIAPIDDTPAQRAGIQTGDLIIRLDDKPVKGMSLTEAIKNMRGEPNSEIELTIVREGTEGSFQLLLKRDVIKVNSVRAEMLEPNYAYVRISNFQANTGGDLDKTIAGLQEQNKQPLKGLILDLRNNPGGLLSAAVMVADSFLNSGLIVYTAGRVPEAESRYKATQGDVLNGMPLIVLVNSGSASASEIVAGAIQDQRRGIVMGEPTFGKGSVQTVLEINQEAAVKLTTARYFTPNGRSIQAEGIQPDIALNRARIELLEQDENSPTPLKEADLSGHLSNTEAQKTATAKNDTKLATRDYALYEALNLLKGLDILTTPYESVKFKQDSVQANQQTEVLK